MKTKLFDVRQNFGFNKRTCHEEFESNVAQALKFMEIKKQEAHGP